MEEMTDCYVVGYWNHAFGVYKDRESAEKALSGFLKKYSDCVPWAVRTVQEALDHAYQTGRFASPIIGKK